MLIAQITDLHLGFEPDNPDEPNARRLAATLVALAALDPRPDLLLVTGDLTEAGAPAAYAQLKAALQACPIPAFPCLGNHDLRGPFAAAFPEVPTAEGFVQYVIEGEALRIVVLDTLEEGRHGGAFCERRAAWLAARLAESARPTLLVLHHPPVATGIDWMTTGPDEPWVRRLAGVVSAHEHVVAAVCGHIHRPLVSPWAGTVVVACPATAPQVALDLKPLDLDAPDDRPLIVDEPPGYGLHLWTGGSLVSHFGMAEARPVLLRYTARMQPALRSFAAEHER